MIVSAKGYEKSSWPAWLGDVGLDCRADKDCYDAGLGASYAQLDLHLAEAQLGSA